VLEERRRKPRNISRGIDWMLIVSPHNYGVLIKGLFEIGVPVGLASHEHRLRFMGHEANKV